jgi:NDP-sugar pyrophosphorylase family protein
MSAAPDPQRSAPPGAAHGEPPNTGVSGIILAGTYPWTNSRFDRLLARALVPVAHRPLIAYGLSALQRAGIAHVTICGNRNTQALAAWLESRRQEEPHLSYLEDAMPRGSAGCVLDVAAADDSQTFVVTDGTSIPNVDLARLLERHRNSGAAATVAVYPERRASGEHMPRIPVGVYIFEGHALRSVPRRGFLDIKEHLIPALVRSGERVATYEGSGMTLRVWNEQTYLATNEAVMAAMASSDKAPEGYQRRGDAWIHADASVADDVVLAGPILIAPGAMVRPKAVLIGPTSIGLDVTVGAGALVSRSAVWRRSNIRAGAMVDRAVIADDSVV